MKKRYWLFLLLLAACAPVREPVVPQPEPVVELPVVEPPAPVGRAALQDNIYNYIISKDVKPFKFATSDAIYDTFSIINVERYDARYHSDLITVLVHLFKFGTRQELEVVLASEFYDVINRGASSHQGNNIALFLTQNDHRVAIWSSGNTLVYVDTSLKFAAREVIEAYLEKYPSDLEITTCIDSDGDDHFKQGFTTRVSVDSTIVEWTDVCLKDFAPYRNKQYVSQKGLAEKDGLLEGRCHQDTRRPGYIFEYPCPRGCVNGACNLS